MEFEVSGEVIEWRGPAPFYFLPMSMLHSDELRIFQKELSYGWGVIPCKVVLGDVTATTSLIPRGGTFLVPLKKALTEPAGISVGDQVTLRVLLRT